MALAIAWHGSSAVAGIGPVAVVANMVAGPLPGLAMLAAAHGLRRSLGSWPALGAALAMAVVEAMVAAALPSGPGWPALAGSLAMPLALFLLARRQVVPGLRRGQMTAAERQRWIVAHALAPADRNGPRAWAAPGARLPAR